MTAHIDRDKSFIATIGGATRPEDCFLSSFMQRRRATTDPMYYSQPQKEVSPHLFLFGRALSSIHMCDSFFEGKALH